jgi:hypothetical protein
MESRDAVDPDKFNARIRDMSARSVAMTALEPKRRNAPQRPDRYAA